MGKNKIIVALAAAIFCLVTAAVAATAVTQLPFKTTVAHEYKDKLYGRGTLEVGPDGNGKVVAFFSNSRKWEGPKTVEMTAVIYTAEGPLIAHHFREQLPDPLFHGGTVERVQVKPVNLPPEQWAKVTDVKFNFARGIEAWECDFLKQKAKENPHIYFNEALCK